MNGQSTLHSESYFLAIVNDRFPPDTDVPKAAAIRDGRTDID
jgi:hypothetical protein